MKIKDLRPGKQVYRVNAFPTRPQQSYITVATVDSLPYKTDSGATFIDITKLYASEDEKTIISYQTHMSLMDSNVIPNRYNFHGLFFSPKAARRHMERINRKEFTIEERVKYARYVENEELENRRNQQWDDWT